MMTRRLLVVAAAMALALAACGGGDDSGSETTSGSSDGGTALVGNAVDGAAVYSGTCSSCHGPDLGGLEGLGKPLAPSEFVTANTEDELVAFIEVGRPAGDPANTQGVDMPPKGGNPSLTDQDLHDVAAYLKAQN